MGESYPRARVPASRGLLWPATCRYIVPTHRTPNARTSMVEFETHGPLGTLWVGMGLSAFYIALIWINTLLGAFLTPLFIIPLTWFTGGKKKPKA
jgi:hypothetical protein